MAIADLDEPLMPRRGAPSIGRGGFIALGILLMIVGTISLLFPLMAAFSLNIVVGVSLLTGGIMTLVHAFRVRSWRGFGIQLLLALLYIGGGLIILFNPFAGLIALSLMLGAFFAAEGTARIMLAFRIRPERAWWLFALSGALSVILGIMVLLGLPSGWSVAFLGIVVGLNLVITGFSFVCCTGTPRQRRSRLESALPA